VWDVWVVSALNQFIVGWGGDSNHYWSVESLRLVAFNTPLRRLLQLCAGEILPRFFSWGTSLCSSV